MKMARYLTTEEICAYSRFPAFTKTFRELTCDMKPAEVADLLGLSRATIGFYLNGDRIPDAASIAKIAKGFGVSADWLLGLSDVRCYNSDLKNVCDTLGLSQEAVLRLKEGRKRGDLITVFIDFLLSSDGLYQKLSVLFENFRTALKYSDNPYYKLNDDDISMANDGRITLSAASANVLYTASVVAAMNEAVMNFCHKVNRFPLHFLKTHEEKLWRT